MRADQPNDNLRVRSPRQRVTKQVLQGAGCSACTGGLGTYTFASATSTFADGYNTWRTKQVTTLPDGNTQTSYVNFAGQSILDVFKDTTTNQEWLTFRKYDGNGRIVLLANRRRCPATTPKGRFAMFK